MNNTCLPTRGASALPPHEHKKKNDWLGSRSLSSWSVLSDRTTMMTVDNCGSITICPRVRPGLKFKEAVGLKSESRLSACGWVGRGAGIASIDNFVKLENQGQSGGDRINLDMNGMRVLRDH
jgi:hypothetical protein